MFLEMKVQSMGLTVHKSFLIILAVLCSEFTSSSEDLSTKSNGSYQESVPVLIWASSMDGLHALEFNSSSSAPFFANKSSLLTKAVAVDFNIRAQTVYWTDVIDDKIFSTNLGSHDVHTVLEGDLDTPEGLALDWIQGNLYWTNHDKHIIGVAKADGSCRKNLITDNLDSPRGIAVDPNNGWLFWTDWARGENARIERCGLNGKHRETIIETDIHMPNGLSIDYTNSRIYWVDAGLDRISSSDFDGDNYRVVVTNHELSEHPFGITVFGECLFWTDWMTNGIYRQWKKAQNSTSEPEVVTVKKLETQPMDITMYHISRQPIYVNRCAEAECSHLCLPTPKMTDETQPTFECACPDSMELLTPTQCAFDPNPCETASCSHLCLNVSSDLDHDYQCGCPDGMTLIDATQCLSVEEQVPVLIWASSGDGLQALEFNSSSAANLFVNKLPSRVKRAVGVDFNIRAETVYWTEVIGYKILSINTVSQEVRTVLEGDLARSDGLALDWIQENLYWTNKENKIIGVVKSDSTCRKTLITENLDKPRGIAVDPNNGWLYWTDWGKNPRIERCGLNGKHREIIIENYIRWPNGLTIDYTDRRLYWADSGMDRIGSSDFEGDNYRDVLMNHKTIGHPFGITVFGEYLFWTDWMTRGVHRINKWTDAQDYTGEEKPEVTTIKELVSQPMDITMYHISKQPIYVNRCAEAECSHLCLPTPKMSDETQPTFECACPDGMGLLTPNQCATGHFEKVFISQDPSPSEGSTQGKEKIYLPVEINRTNRSESFSLSVVFINWPKKDTSSQMAKDLKSLRKSTQELEKKMESIKYLESRLDTLNASLQSQPRDLRPVLDKMNSSLLKKESTMQSMVLAIGAMNKTLVNQRRRIGNQRNIMKNLRRSVATLQSKVKSHDDAVMYFKRQQLLRRHNEYRIASVPVNGRHVFSSKTAFNKIAEAKKACASAGGRIIEMTYIELLDLSPVLKNDGFPFTWYWVGWTRKNDQSDWTFTQSGLPVGDVSWNKPVRKGAKCARFLPGSQLFEAEFCRNRHSIPVLCTL